MNFKKITTILFLGVSCQVYAQNSEPFVIPKLQKWSGETGFFALKNTINLVTAKPISNEELNGYIKTFANDLKAVYPRKEVRIKIGAPSKGDIFFDSDTAQVPNAKEGYLLRINDYLTINSTKPIGSFWATRTILQILEQDPAHQKIPKGIAFDAPKYEVRGFVIDVARKFFTIDFLRDYVKLMSYYKLNDFQIHLNDNGFKQFFNDDWSKTYSAFRLQNDTYPTLTAKDGSYSKQEFIDLQKLGNAYGVNIIPEIDAPAHALAITKVFSELASKKYGADHLDISNPKSYEVMHNIFKEYLQGSNPVFFNKEVHIGTDEYAKEEAENFRKFTDSTIKFVEKYNKKVRLWGALTHAKGKTPVKSENITMNLWYNGFAEPADMFALGYSGISTPDQWLYIVPKAGYYFDYLNLNNVYKKWAPNVIGDKVFPENMPQIKGGAFAVWNDHVGNGISQNDVTDRVFPALQVLAQKMWIGNKADSLLTFDKFQSLSSKIGEGPGINLRGKHLGKSNLVLHYLSSGNQFKDISGNKQQPLTNANTEPLNGMKKMIHFKGGKSFVQTPINEIGYGYTVCFEVKPSKGNQNNAVLFSSPSSSVKLKQLNTNKLGFSRDGYDYNFNYVVPEEVWTKIAISGDSKGTSLYVNGIFVERLEGKMQIFKNTKDKMATVQTLFFPLKYIGDPLNSFAGSFASLAVYNQVLTAEVIRSL
ncbi:family 20 glycosylhydrolase [Pedobacter ginsengiterrae]|uniref:Family 20 glycosylhydrolase n=1 Tax=Pedobacter ginsengiterrae TaxID=871696 RepID=A0ABP7NMP6_9SPHI